jgi:hypothetical protein
MGYTQSELRARGPCLWVSGGRSALRLGPVRRQRDKAGQFVTSVTGEWLSHMRLYSLPAGRHQHTRPYDGGLQQWGPWGKRVGRYQHQGAL